MTQAFNLSQLANNLNSSGQLDATDGLTGAVPVANGGTGLTSTPLNGQLNIGNGSGFTRATLTAGSNISITNGAGSITIASTAGGGVTSLNGQTGAITNTTYASIGSYVIAYGPNTTSGDTVAGSSLNYGSGGATSMNARINTDVGPFFPEFFTNNTSGLGLSGTWRSMTRNQMSGNPSNYGLWVRVS